MTKLKKAEETVIIKEGTYADMLKKMKSNVTASDIRQMGIVVTSVKK